MLSQLQTVNDQEGFAIIGLADCWFTMGVQLLKAGLHAMLSAAQDGALASFLNYGVVCKSFSKVCLFQHDAHLCTYGYLSAGEKGAGPQSVSQAALSAMLTLEDKPKR